MMIIVYLFLVNVDPNLLDCLLLLSYPKLLYSHMYDGINIYALSQPDEIYSGLTMQAKHQDRDDHTSMDEDKSRCFG